MRSLSVAPFESDAFSCEPTLAPVVVVPPLVTPDSDVPFSETPLSETPLSETPFSATPLSDTPFDDTTSWIVSSKSSVASMQPAIPSTVIAIRRVFMQSLLSSDRRVRRGAGRHRQLAQHERAVREVRRAGSRRGQRVVRDARRNQ